MTPEIVIVTVCNHQITYEPLGINDPSEITEEEFKSILNPFRQFWVVSFVSLKGNPITLVGKSGYPFRWKRSLQVEAN